MNRPVAPDPLRPALGATCLLVYRECPHGCWCATGEGATAPRCSAHNQPMIPGGGPKGMFGALDGSDWQEVARDRRLGFVALFGYETAAHHWQQALGKLLCLFSRGDKWTVGHHHQRIHGSRARYFTEEEISGRLRELGWDGESWTE